jgi:hypothetical protein
LPARQQALDETDHTIGALALLLLGTLFRIAPTIAAQLLFLLLALFVTATPIVTRLLLQRWFWW